MGNCGRVWLIAASLIMISAAPVRADDQDVSDTVTLKNYSDQNTSVFFRSTNVTDVMHFCTSNTSNPCTVSNGYPFVPANISHALCLLPEYTLTVTSSCQALLNTGYSDKCEGNSMNNYCKQIQSLQGIYPLCNWRTSGQKSTPATWFWTVTFENGVYSVDCSEQGYQGAQQ